MARWYGGMGVSGRRRCACAVATLVICLPAALPAQQQDAASSAPPPTTTSAVPDPSAAALAALMPTPAPGARTLSLADALQLAEQGAESLRIADAEVDRAAGQRRRARSQRYPQLFGTGSYTRTLASEFEDLSFDFGDDGGGGDAGELPFGQRNQYRLGLQVEQTLWAGGRIAGQTRAAEAVLDAAEVGLAATRAGVQLQVTEAYFDALLFDRLVVITTGTLELSETAYRHTRLAYEVGNQSEFELLRAQVARDNQRPELLQRSSDRELAYLRLRQLLDLPATEPIALTTGFAEFADWPATTPPPADRAAREEWLTRVVDGRSPVRQARAAVEQQEQLLRVAKAERWPSLAVSSDYGRVDYPASGLADPFDMRTNWTVALGFRVPLYTGGRVAGEVGAVKAGLDEAQARLDQVRELARLDAQEALERLASAEAVWSASAGTAEQAQRAYQIADLRYREGLSTQLELSDARLLLQQALGNRALAARNLQVARARVALLPDLPLGGGAPLAVPAGAFPQTLTPGAAGAPFTLAGPGGR
jgi:outer membrane protein